MHLLQPFGYVHERFPETAFESPLKLLVHGRAHLVKLLRVVILNLS